MNIITSVGNGIGWPCSIVAIGNRCSCSISLSQCIQVTVLYAIGLVVVPHSYRSIAVATTARVDGCLCNLLEARV